MAKPATPKQVRQARAFLQKRGLTSRDVSPRMFANAAKERNKSFTELLAFIARLYMGGQNEAFFRREQIRSEAMKE